MVYLSANGEVIGQFEESELPSFLAEGRLGPEAFFWREGMAEWRPLRELVLPPLRPAAPARPTASGPAAPHPQKPAPDKLAPAEPGRPSGPAKSSPVVRKVFLPRAKPAALTDEPPRPAAGPAKSSPFIIPARPSAQPAAREESSPAVAAVPEDAAVSAPVQPGDQTVKPGPFVIPARPAMPSVRAAEPSPAEATEPQKITLPAPARPADHSSKRSPFVIPARPAAPTAPSAESSPVVAAGPEDTAASVPVRPPGPPAKPGPFVIPTRSPAVAATKASLPVGRGLGVPRAGGIISAPPKPASAPPSTSGKASAPAPVAKTALPPVRTEAPPAASPAGPAPSAAPAPSTRLPFAGAVPKRRGVLRAALLTLLGLLLAGGLGAAAWWFWPLTPPSLTGEVRLDGTDGSPVPVAEAGVFLVSREELVAQWRGQLAELRSRAAEVDQLLEPARATHREKVLALELAARISELGDEYNMPDAEQLRADRDAAQAEETAAAAEVEKLSREKESSADASTLMRNPPEALERTQTDAAGAFSLPLPASTEGLVVLVVAGAADESAAARGWLVPLPGPDEATPAPVRLSAGNALDSAQIEEIAATDPAATAEELNGEPEAPR